MRLNTFFLLSCLLLSACSQASTPEADSTKKTDKQTEVSSEKSAPEKSETVKPETTSSEIVISDKTEPKESEETEKAPEVPKTIVRKTLEGRWILSMYQRLIKMPVAIIEVSKEQDSNEYKVSTLEIHSQFPPSKPEAAWAKDNEIQITYNAGDGNFIFSAKKVGNTIKGTGTFSIQNGSCLPAELTPTEIESFEGIKAAPVSTRELYVAAVSSENPVESLQKIIDEHSNNPVALQAGLKLIEISKKNKLNSEAIEKNVQSYIKLAEQWGKPLDTMVRVNSIFALLNSDSSPQLALKLSDETKANFNEQTKFLWEELINRASTMAKREIVIDNAINGTGEVQEKAIASLKDEQNNDPFNPIIISTLASYHQKKGNTDQAIEDFAKIAAFPQMAQMLQQMQSDASTDQPSAMESLTELWKKKHNGSTDELEEYINKIYKDKITSFVKESYPVRKPEDGTRKVLCEFFTGAMCPPCVGADIALAGLSKKYAETEYIQLTYHQHIPGPDALANLDTEARFTQYGIRGTPSVFINGKQVNRVASGVQQSIEVYESIQKLFEPILKEKTNLTINLKADASDGNLNISAEVKGLKEIPDSYRLRLALAESEIELPVRNGIRVHHMTVREMPGGVEGISSAGGELKYSDTISLGKFKYRIENYLSNFANGSTMSFGNAPLEFNKMKLVAFVQNEDTGEVLQSNSIDVSGKLIFKPYVDKDKIVIEEAKDDKPAETKPEPAPEIKIDLKPEPAKK